MSVATDDEEEVVVPPELDDEEPPEPPIEPPGDGDDGPEPEPEEPALIKGLVVTFENYLTDEGVRVLGQAIGMLRNVMAVEVVRMDPSDQVSEMRVRQDISRKLVQAWQQIVWE